MEDFIGSVRVDYSRRYTLEEFLALPKPEDGSRFELIKGYLYIIPPPDPLHEAVVARMGRALSEFLISNNIDGEVLFPPEAICSGAESSTDLDPDDVRCNDG